MPRVGARRQITLPVGQCKEAGLEPRDEYRSFVVDGRITIVRKVPGAAKRFLRHVAETQSLATKRPCKTRWTSEYFDHHRYECAATLSLQDDEVQAGRIGAVFNGSKTVLTREVVNRAVFA